MALKPTTDTPLHVLKFDVGNFLRIHALTITPTPGEPIVRLSGENAQGKSSAIKAIAAGIDWAAVSKDVPDPIHHGQEKAWSRLLLGPPGGEPELEVERTWTEKGTYLKVGPWGDKPVKGPQTYLDQFKGLVTFNPLRFIEADAKTLRKLLLEVAELPVDLDELDRQEKESELERTVVNRELKNLEAELSGMVRPSSETPKAEIDLGPYHQAVTDAKTAGQHLDAQHELHRAAVDRVARLRRELAEAEEAEATVFLSLDRLKALADPVVLDRAQSALEEAKKANEAVAGAKAYRAKLDTTAAKRAEAAEAEKKLQGIRQDRQDALECASWPLPGLSVTPDGVIYNGTPLVQASRAERLRISAALGMAKAEPRIRVMLIPEGGNDLDAESWAVVEEIAREHGYQVWIETIQPGEGGFVIHDGEVMG